MGRSIPTVCNRCGVIGCCGCKRLRRADVRRQRDPLLDSGRWDRLRRIILARDPVCRACGRAASVDVDHILPRRERPDLALAMDNLQGLCRPCHASKTRAGW